RHRTQAKKLQPTAPKTAALPRVLLLAILLFGAVLRVANLGIPQRISADEQVYRAQAEMIAGSGLIAGNRATTQLYLQDDRMKRYPPPTRLAYVVPVAWLMRASGVRTEVPGAYLSCAASIGDLALTALIGMEFFGEWIAVVGVLLLSVFPPDLVL